MATDVSRLRWIIASGISSLILLTLFITLLKKLYCGVNAANKNIDIISQIITISVFMFNIIYSLCLFAFHIYISLAYSHDKHINDLIFYIFPIIIGISLSGGFVSIYIYLLFKIKNTFNETVYQIKSRIIYLHIINITFIFSSFCIIFFILTFSRNTVKTGLILHSSLFFLLTIGYIHLLFTFNHNLFLLVLSQRQIISKSKKNIELNERQHALLETIRKHSILACFMIFISFAFVIMAIVVSRYYDGYQYENIIIQYLWIITLFIFMNTGPLCIYLGFTMNRNMYTKLCGVCDKKCKNLCITMAEKKLNKKSTKAPDIVIKTIEM